MKLSYKGTMRRWAEKACQPHAERIRAFCSWNKSTGPRTEEGKARPSRNAGKGGLRSTAAEYAVMFPDFGKMTKVLVSSIGGKGTKTALAQSALIQPNSSSRLSTSFGPFQKRNTENGKRNTPPVLSTSFGKKGGIPPWHPFVRRKPVELPADLEPLPDTPEFDTLSPEALIAMAEALLGGGSLSTSFGAKS